MVTLGYILVGIFALGGLVALHMVFWRRFYWAEIHPDETHLLRCEDGARVALHRYRGQEALAAHPILVCHGLMTHCLFMDLTPELSLAGYLNRLGFEVWNLELRGTGRYGRPMPWDRRGWRIHLDDFVDRDAPTALAHIEAITGASQVHWVGHSMGGLIGAVVAQGPHAERLASLCCIGSPGRVNAPWFLMALGRLLWLLAWLPFVPTAWIMRFLAPFYTWLPVDVLAIRQENMRVVDIRRLMANGIEDIPWTLASQAMAWAVGGEVVAARDDRNFSRGMALIQTPLLCITGDDDRVVPPATVRFIHEAASSAHRRFIHLGGSEGPGVRYQPYGHADLVLGRRSAVDVFPWVAHHIIEVSGVAVEAPEPGHGFPTEWPQAAGDAMDEDLRAAPMDGYGVEPAQAPAASAARPVVDDPERPEEAISDGFLDGAPDDLDDDLLPDVSGDGPEGDLGDDLDDASTPDGADELLDDAEEDGPAPRAPSAGSPNGASAAEVVAVAAPSDTAASEPAVPEAASEAVVSEAASDAVVATVSAVASEADAAGVDSGAAAVADAGMADAAVVADEIPQAAQAPTGGDLQVPHNAEARAVDPDDVEVVVGESPLGAAPPDAPRSSEAGQPEARAQDSSPRALEAPASESEEGGALGVSAPGEGGASEATSPGAGGEGAQGAAQEASEGDDEDPDADQEEGGKLARVAARLASYGDHDEVGLLSSRSLASRLSRDSAEIRRRPPPGWLPEGTGARRPRPGRLHRAPVGDAVLEALEQSAQRVDEVLGRTPRSLEDDEE